MYGLIGKISATPGKRDDLVTILTDSTGEMPGCLSYVIALDLDDADAIWVTEVWIDETSHQASLQLPQVQAAIGRARPIIAGFSHRTVTRPIGGHGL
jgi:quinol monooxygenase YgiN